MKFKFSYLFVILSICTNWVVCEEEDMIDKINEGMFDSNLIEKFVKEAQNGTVCEETKRKIVEEGKRVVGKMSKMQLDALSKEVDISDAMDFIYGPNVRAGQDVLKAEGKLRQKGLNPDDAFLYFKFLHGDTLVRR